MGVYANGYYNELKKAQDTAIAEYGSNSSVTFLTFYSALLSSFEWKGKVFEDIPYYLPEEFLTNWGNMAYFIDDDGNKRVFPSYPAGEYLENGLYSKYVIIAKNGKNWYRNLEDIELCFCNSIRIPSIVFAKHYADKATYAYSAVDTSLYRAMLPVILETENPEDFSEIAELLEKREYLKVFKAVQSSKFKDKNITATQIFDSSKTDILSLWDVAERYRNLYNTLIGISNVNIQKRERLTENESESNREASIFTMYDDEYKERKNFVERVKKHFNDDIDVLPNRTTSNIFEVIQTPEEKARFAEIEMTRGAGNVQNVDTGSDNNEG